ncbi:MAG: hypothetical protein FIA95_10265 [Gemmatimonadetes bacterium]|nr:hypothetical protein [Gemmatimonadota bacterium]
MSPLRGMAGPAYLLAAILIVFPAIEVVAAIWPARFGDITWRVTSVNVLSGAVLLPLLGLFLAHALSIFLEQWRVVKVLSWINVALAVILVLGLGVYALDASGLRAETPRTAQFAFDLRVVVSFARYGLGLLTLAALVYSQRRALRELRRRAQIAEAERMAGQKVKAELPPLFFHGEGRTRGKPAGKDERTPDAGEE